MNLSKLMKAQKKLDDRIVKEKGLEGKCLLDKKILALQVELGELANEWRGFKFWSEDQSPNITYCHACNGYGYFDSTYQEACDYCHATGIQENPLLEEYVDCLHFILSIGNDIGIKLKGELPSSLVNYTVLDSFSNIFYYVARFSELKTSLLYKNFLITFVHLGKRLGFTWDEIEQAYYAKNKINHKRQEQGY